MKHNKAKLYLADLAAGELDVDVEQGLKLHVANCQRCRHSLDTIELFVETRTWEPGSGGHPESELLALYVVGPGEVYDHDHEELCAHLEQCWACRRDVESIGQAVAEARPNEQKDADAPAPSFLSRPRPQQWLAAGLAALALAAAFWFGPQLTGKIDIASVWQRPEQLPVEKQQRVAEVEEFSGRELVGATLIQAEQNLKVTDIRVMSGANLDIRAGDRISFGQGFQVGPSARLAVGNSQPGQSGLQRPSGGSA